MIEKPVSGGGQRLRNYVLVHISEICRQFVAEQLLVDYILREGLVLECKSREEVGEFISVEQTVFTYV